MAFDLPKTLHGALTTLYLVGREETIASILARINDDRDTSPCIIFFTGPGGIGKTRLLMEISDRCKEISNVKVSDREQLIDVYHLHYHKPYELAQAIYESLKPLEEPFRTFERDAHMLERLKLSGDAVKVEEQQAHAIHAFLDDLKAFAKKRRVVILLDTIERLIYSVGDEISGIPSSAESWKWLVKELANLSNVMVIAAGRPQAESLFQGILSSIETRVIEVEAFSQNECRQYFDAAALRAIQNKAENVARVLKSVSPEEREQAHRLSGGRPILLAMLADYISKGGSFSLLLEDVSSEAEKGQMERFQEKILDRLLNTERLGMVFRCMALMPKGVDAELLSAVMSISQAEARGYLQQIKEYSFVKRRRFSQNQPKDIYFLHDELYDLLNKAVFTGLKGYNEKQTIYRRTIDCYEEQFKEVRRQLADLYSGMQAGGNSEIAYEMLSTLLAQRMEILLALLYYRLRQEPAKGYRRWFRYDHEATISGDLALSDQLRLEILNYLGELAGGNAADAPGWDPDLVHWSLLLRSVKRAWTKKDNQKVLEEVRKLEDAYASDLDDPIKKAMLLVWKGYALAASDPPEAHIELESLISELMSYYDRQTNEMLRWLAQALLAFAFRVRGYVFRIQEQINPAIDSYRRAAVLLREVDLKIEMATIYNDLGYALALQGDWSDARSLIENALDIRRNLGLGEQVASSLNTLAIVDLHEGYYSDATENATKSLTLSRAVESRRRTGLALIALAEATRRHSGILISAEAQARLDMLNRAVTMADEALEIFVSMGEKSRQVEALIEKGCAKRDAIRLFGDSSIPPFSKERWLRESRQALEKAQDIAAELVDKPRVHYRQADALVNLAWLGYYANGEEGEAIQKDAEVRVNMLLKEYQIPKGRSKPEIYGTADFQPLLSTQLGKLHILRGHRIYKNNPDTWRKRISDAHKEPDVVKEVYKQLAREYFLGLENSAMYSPEYRDLRLVKQQIFDNLKLLRLENMRLFVECIDDLEEYYDLPNIPGSQLRQLLVKRVLWQPE